MQIYKTQANRKNIFANLTTHEKKKCWKVRKYNQIHKHTASRTEHNGKKKLMNIPGHTWDTLFAAMVCGS